MFLAFDLPAADLRHRPAQCLDRAIQALILMNDEFMELESGEWAKRVTAEESDPGRRIRKMYQAAFARDPEDWELKEALAFVKTGQWRDLAHVLFNSAEFIYVR
jgi:hypothetical protein